MAREASTAEVLAVLAAEQQGRAVTSDDLCVASLRLLLAEGQLREPQELVEWRSEKGGE